MPAQRKVALRVLLPHGPVRLSMLHDCQQGKPALPVAKDVRRLSQEIPCLIGTSSPASLYASLRSGPPLMLCRHKGKGHKVID